MICGEAWLSSGSPFCECESCCYYIKTCPIPQVSTITGLQDAKNSETEKQSRVDTKAKKQMLLFEMSK